MFKLPIALIACAGILAVFICSPAWSGNATTQARVQQKVKQVEETFPKFVAAGGNPRTLEPLTKQLDKHMKAGRLEEGEIVLDQILAVIRPSNKPVNTTIIRTPAAQKPASSASPLHLWQKCVPNEKVQCDVWVINSDGSGATNLTPNTEKSFDFDMQWSPDHSKIVFTSTRGGNPDIYTMNADGSGVTQLTTDPGFESWASYSPDGKQIVFIRGIKGKLQLHLMNADGSGQKQLHASHGDDEEPAFSPDGSKILFGSNRTGTYQLYLINTDGSGLIELTKGPEHRYPSWSPDGKKIVFGGKHTGHTEIYTMNADGTDLVRLTTSTGGMFNSDPEWSSDGLQIIFASTRDRNPEIYTMNPDGSNQKRLTTDTSFDAGPYPW